MGRRAHSDHRKTRTAAGPASRAAPAGTHGRRRGDVGPSHRPPGNAQPSELQRPLIYGEPRFELLRTARMRAGLNLLRAPTSPVKSTIHAADGLLARVLDVQWLDAAVQLPVSTVAPAVQPVLKAGDTAGVTFAFTS